MDAKPATQVEVCLGRVLQPPHKFENFIVATSTLLKLEASHKNSLGQVS